MSRFISDASGSIATPLTSLFRQYISEPLPKFLDTIEVITDADVIPGVLEAAELTQVTAQDRKGVGGDLQEDPLPLDNLCAILKYCEEDTTPSLYSELNRRSFEKDRSQIRPFLPYMWLLVKTLELLQPYEGSTVNRGVKEDLQKDYPVGREFTWHGFTSTTKDVGILSNPMFLGTTGKRTLFQIELTQSQARDISMYSPLKEGEVLLPSGSRFTVKGVLPAGSGLCIVQLIEIPSPAWIINLRPTSEFGMKEMADIFAMLDQDGNGRITKEELTHVLTRIGMARSDCRKLLAAADTDGSGDLDYGELVAWLCGDSDIVKDFSSRYQPGSSDSKSVAKDSERHERQREQRSDEKHEERRGEDQNDKLGAAKKEEQAVCDGASLSLQLASHTSQAISLKLHGRFGKDGERRWHLWQLKLAPVDSASVLRIQGDPQNCALIYEAENASIEIDCGRIDEETMLFAYKGGKNDSELRPGGTRWCLNDDGTVQRKGSDFVWGFSNGWAYTCGGKNHKQHDPWPVVLVPKGDPRQLRLIFRVALATEQIPILDPPALTGERFQLVRNREAMQAVKFGQHPGDKLDNGKSSWGGKPYSNKSDCGELELHKPLEHASVFRFSAKGNTIHLVDKPRLGLEVVMREFKAGNRVLLFGPLHYDVHWYCTFKRNGDGTISSGYDTKLVLGFGKCLSGTMYGDGDQCILVNKGDPRQLIARSMDAPIS